MLESMCCFVWCFVSWDILNVEQRGTVDTHEHSHPVENSRHYPHQVLLNPNRSTITTYMDSSNISSPDSDRGQSKGTFCSIGVTLGTTGGPGISNANIKVKHLFISKQQISSKSNANLLCFQGNQSGSQRKTEGNLKKWTSKRNNIMKPQLKRFKLTS